MGNTEKCVSARQHAFRSLAPPESRYDRFSAFDILMRAFIDQSWAPSPETLCQSQAPGGQGVVASIVVE